MVQPVITSNLRLDEWFRTFSIVQNFTTIIKLFAREDGCDSPGKSHFRILLFTHALACFLHDDWQVNLADSITSKVAKMISHKNFSLILAYSILILMISACSGSPSNAGTGNIQSASESASSELVAFDGRVFVATTKPDHQRWLSAGWQISSEVVSGDQDSVPADCTLYPHKGVDDQWIGSCSGSTLIPREGALHIAVMHTSSDGSSRMIQVAPPPLVSDP